MKYHRTDCLHQTAESHLSSQAGRDVEKEFITPALALPVLGDYRRRESLGQAVHYF